MLIRFVAAVLVGWSAVEWSLYFIESHVHQTPVRILPCVLDGIPFLIGIIFFIKSKQLADWLSDLLE